MSKKATVLETVKKDLRSIPPVVTAVFCVTVVCMNLLANKIIYENDLIAADGGLFISWLAFLCMDIVTKAFGQRAATTLSAFALLTNLFACLIFYLVSIVPTEADYTAFNTIFGGTWFILLSSSIAFISSAALNNALNEAVGKAFRKNPDGKLAFFTRSYISTFIGQFWDNFVFSALTFMVFAPRFWENFEGLTLVQCINLSLVGALLELLMEVIFAPLGYMVLKWWRREGICG